MVQCAPVECEKSGSKVREARWAPMQEDNNKLQRQSLVSHLRVQYFWSIVVTNRLIGSGVFSKWRRAYRMDHDLLLASQDYNKLERTHLKAGFREGVEEGKDQVIAQGFTSGYRDGVEASVRWGRLQGRLSAVEVHLKREDQPVSEELLQLKRRLEEVKGVWVAGKRRRGEEEEEEGERVKEEVEDVREFWEVVESSNVPGDLVEIERQVEEMVCRLE